VKPGSFPGFCIQQDEVRFRGQKRRRRDLPTVEAPRSPDPLREMILGPFCEMNVPAQGPGGLLSCYNQGEFTAACLGLCDLGLRRRFVMKDQTWMGGRVQGSHMAVRSVREADDGECFIRPGPDNF
jgi:hypothetical protein